MTDKKNTKTQTQLNAENEAKAAADAKTHSHKAKILERIIKKRDENKQKLSEVEITILELNQHYKDRSEKETIILHTLLETIIDEEEAKALARRKNRARKQQTIDAINELNETRAKYKTANALHIAKKLFSLGVLNKDATYKLSADVFYGFIEANFEAMLQYEQEKNTEVSPQSDLPHEQHNEIEEASLEQQADTPSTEEAPQDNLPLGQSADNPGKWP